MLRYCSIIYTPEGAITHFLDGTSYGAHPHPWDHHYSVIAHRCGYGDDLMRFAREHEVCHSLIAEFLYDRPSPIIWGLAHGKPLTPKEAVAEEACTQLLQRWVRANERPIIGPNVDWDGLKQRALEVLP